MISVNYTAQSVLCALGITAFVCFGVTLFSLQTKFDFTNCFGILLVIALALLGFGIACIFTYSNVSIEINDIENFFLTILFDLGIVYNLCSPWSCGFFNCKFEDFEKSERRILFVFLY
jgi:FtsH-binding integral membrane protein